MHFVNFNLRHAKRYPQINVVFEKTLNNLYMVAVFAQGVAANTRLSNVAK